MTIKFYCARRDDEMMLTVSPLALDRAFATTNPEQYQSVCDGKVMSLMKLPAAERIKAAIIGAYDGRIQFQNGRHRARVAMLRGRKTIPIIVYKDNVDAVRELLAKFRTRSNEHARDSVRILG
jgi:hypothetical protein